MATVGFLLSGDVMGKIAMTTSTRILAIGVLGALVLLVSQMDELSYYRKFIDRPDGPVAHLQSPKPVSLPVTDPAGAGPKVVAGGRQLNDEAVRLISDKKLWEGLYLLEQALSADPKQLAAMLNMAVTLEKMGFDRVAERYRQMAQTTDPASPLLQRKANQRSIVAVKRIGPVETSLPLPIDGDLKEDNTIRLWQDDTLMLWGITGKERY